MGKIVCVDLDGTLASYDVWNGESHFGNVIEGASEALIKLKEENWLIIIFTTRTNKDLISVFLNSNDIPFDYINENPFQPKNAIGGKPYADVYIDDRAIQFNGDWNVIMKEINDFEPWEKKMKSYEEYSVFCNDFLIHDFDQSCQQLRHYDTLNWDITKFSFVELLIGIASVWAIYGFAQNSTNSDSIIGHNYKWLIPTIFGVSYIFSILASFLISRNRVYFAKTARYINEYREFSLRNKPLGFKNTTKFYTNINFPKAFDPWSTQLVSLYVIQLVSASMLGILLYCISCVFIENIIWHYLISCFGGFVSFIVLLKLLVNYMKDNDKKLGK